MSTEWGICLSSTRIDEKSNEIPEMQKVIKQIDWRGCIVTADALNTQKATARAIVKEAQVEERYYLCSIPPAVFVHALILGLK